MFPFWILLPLLVPLEKSSKGTGDEIAHKRINQLIERRKKKRQKKKRPTSERETTIRIKVASSVPAPFMDFHSRSAKYPAGFLEHCTVKTNTIYINIGYFFSIGKLSVKIHLIMVYYLFFLFLRRNKGNRRRLHAGHLLASTPFLASEARRERTRE